MLYNASKMEQPPNIIYESKVLFSSGIYGVVVVFSCEFELRNRITRLKMENLRRCCRLENTLTGCPIKICCAETKRNFSSVVPRKTYYARLPNRNLYYIKMGKCEAQKIEDSRKWTQVLYKDVRLVILFRKIRQRNVKRKCRSSRAFASDISLISYWVLWFHKFFFPTRDNRYFKEIVIKRKYSPQKPWM